MGKCTEQIGTVSGIVKRVTPRHSFGPSTILYKHDQQAGYEESPVATVEGDGDLASNKQL